MIWTLFLVILIFFTLVSSLAAPGLFWTFAFITFFLVVSSIRVVYEYQRGVIFTFGKYTATLGPGLKIIIPAVQQMKIVDLRLEVDDVPEQSPITKDNVSISVDAVIYYRVMDTLAHYSIIKVDDYRYAISQLAQTTMRNVIGEMELDEVLSNRDEASRKIQLIVDEKSDPWGIKVEAVELKHVELPDSMKKVMAKAAEAERIKRAAIIKSAGEAQAAKVISKAAEIISSVDGGLNLRTLQGLGGVASDSSNEVVFFVPVDVLRPINGYGGEKKRGGKK